MNGYEKQANNLRKNDIHVFAFQWQNKNVYKHLHINMNNITFAPAVCIVGLIYQSTIFQSCWDGTMVPWVN